MSLQLENSWFHSLGSDTYHHEHHSNDAVPNGHPVLVVIGPHEPDHLLG